MDSQAEEIFSADLIAKMQSSNWKERLEAVEDMTKVDASVMFGLMPLQNLDG